MYPGKWAQKFPEKPAVINAATGDSISYKQLNERSNQLANLMFDMGVRPGDHVAIFMENNLRYFEVLWAAMRSGLYLTPINRYLTDEEAGYILDNCEAKVLVASKFLEEVAAKIPQHAPNCKTCLMVDGVVEGYESYEDKIANQSIENLAEEPAGQFMLYSSGTTGQPKGIFRAMSGDRVDESAGPIGGMLTGLWSADENSIYLSPAPLYHSAPSGFCHGVQALGGTIVMMPKFDGIAALKAIEEYKVTHSQWVPTMFSRMLKMPEADLKQFDLSSHKVAIHAAAPCPAGIKKKMFDWWGPIIYEYYGGTELNGFTHCAPQEWLANEGTVGKPLLGIIHICDEEGKELPVGEAGIVYFEMPQMPFEYHKDPSKTKKAQHPDHDNWSALGDVGYVNKDGYLFLTDRSSFMIISGGVNIYPQEIENEMILHDKIADVAVIGVPSEEMGEEVKAVVQLIPGVEASDELAAELVGYARENIAHYKCPKSVDFTDELPRLPTGKLYKRVLKDKYWSKKGSRIV
ncbi:MAG: AMP-binding protein [Pseudomonadales bacterium]|nr:AMP-binding protein [Pseudomonadales bacterium]